MNKAALLPIFFLLALITLSCAAESYIVVDNQTGHILTGKNQDAKVQVASLTKVATAIVTLDWARIKNGDLSRTVDVPASAIQDASGVNPTGLQVGDQISLRDLLYCALLASDNVAATTLGYHVGSALPNPQQLDSVDNFVSHMNALARDLKMNRTLFLNPAGFDSNRDGALPYSTAEDMARLTQYGYTDSAFPFYVAQKTRTVHILRNGVDNPIELQNTNQLLNVEGIDGVKTGRTNKAGDCVILSSDRAPESLRDGDHVTITPRRIIAVVLGSTDRFGEGVGLMRQGWLLYDKWAAAGRKTKSGNTL